MKKKLQKQMDSMMEMTMEAITNNKKLAPALNELFKYVYTLIFKYYIYNIINNFIL